MNNAFKNYLALVNDVALCCFCMIMSRQELCKEPYQELANQRTLSSFWCRDSFKGSQRSSGVVEWWGSVSKLMESTRVGSNQVIGTTNHRPTANSAAHPCEVGKRVLRGS